MTLEEKIGKDMTHKEAMEGFKQYLNISKSKIPKSINITIGIIKSFCKYPRETLYDIRMREHPFKDFYGDNEEENWEKNYERAGCTTRQEKDALRIAEITIGGISIYARTAKQRGKPQGIIPKTYFECRLKEDMEYGMEDIQWTYLNETGATCKINKDFPTKAREWLINEIYSRIKGRQKIILLDNISIEEINDKEIQVINLEYEKFLKENKYERKKWTED